MKLKPDEDDGAEYLLSSIEYTAESYKEWAYDYFEREIDGQSIKQIYDGADITAELIRKLNDQADVEHKFKELAEAGYR